MNSASTFICIKIRINLITPVKCNFDLFYFGGIVLNEVKKRGLEINNENEKMVREDLRRQHGNGVLAKIASETIAKTDSTILLDGLYSFTEYKILKELYPEYRLFSL